MNLILFEAKETGRALPISDRRAIHLMDVLRRNVGDSFDAGLVNGPRGKGRILEINDHYITLSFDWDAPHAHLDPITLLVGLPRPQSARKILHDATMLGVSAIHFVLTERGERNYAESTLWRSREWRRHLIAGAEQAFCTHLPEVTYGRRLDETLKSLQETGSRIALDNYESSKSISELSVAKSSSLTLAVGAERGWSNTERVILRDAEFVLAHMGRRVLRMETACVAALAVIKAQSGWW